MDEPAAAPATPPAETSPQKTVLGNIFQMAKDMPPPTVEDVPTSTLPDTEPPPPSAMDAEKLESDLREAHKTELARLGEAAFVAFKKRLAGKDRYPRLADSFAKADTAQKLLFVQVALDVLEAHEKGPDWKPDEVVEPAPLEPAEDLSWVPPVSGCLACNGEAIAEALEQIGLSLHRFEPVPEEVAGPNVHACKACGQNWILQGDQP
jgi:hypothetical protein